MRGGAVADEEHSEIRAHLKLSGAVKGVEGALAVRNQLYRSVFSEKWAREHRPSINWGRRARSYVELLRAAPPRVVVVLGGVIIAVGVAVLLKFLAARSEPRPREVAAEPRSGMVELEWANQKVRDEASRFIAAQNELGQAIRLSHARDGEQKELLDKLERLQRLHDAGAIAERTRGEVLLQDRDAQLQNVYLALAFSQSPGPLRQPADQPDRPFAFIKGPPHVAVTVEPCRAGAEVEHYRLNDLADPGSAQNASAFALPGGFDALANAVRSQAALFLIRGKRGSYLVSYDDGGHRKTSRVDLQDSGRIVDLAALSSGRCP
jgi:hypothetical protein